jgi:hypothetical protein
MSHMNECTSGKKQRLRWGALPPSPSLTAFERGLLKQTPPARSDVARQIYLQAPITTHAWDAESRKAAVAQPQGCRMNQPHHTHVGGTVTLPHKLA